jgi:hypothetical protein
MVNWCGSATGGRIAQLDAIPPWDTTSVGVYGHNPPNDRAVGHAAGEGVPPLARRAVDGRHVELADEQPVKDLAALSDLPAGRRGPRALCCEGPGASAARTTRSFRAAAGWRYGHGVWSWMFPPSSVPEAT